MVEHCRGIMATVEVEFVCFNTKTYEEYFGFSVRRLISLDAVQNAFKAYSQDRTATIVKIMNIDSDWLASMLKALRKGLRAKKKPVESHVICIEGNLYRLETEEATLRTHLEKYIGQYTYFKYFPIAKIFKV